ARSARVESGREHGATCSVQEDSPSLRPAYFRFFVLARQNLRDAAADQPSCVAILTAPATPPADGFSAPAPWRPQPSLPAAPSRRRAPRSAARARATRRTQLTAPRA